MKQKRKGFTLVELLGVIVLLGIIAILVIGIITKQLKDTKQELYDAQIELIALATKNWATDRLLELPTIEGEKKTIYLYQLKLDGYIEMSIKNSKTGEEFPNNMEIEIVRQNSQYVDRVIEESGDKDFEIPESES